MRILTLYGLARRGAEAGIAVAVVLVLGVALGLAWPGSARGSEQGGGPALAALAEEGDGSAKEGENPPKEGDKPAKEGDKPAKEGDKPAKEGENPPKEGDKPPKQPGGEAEPPSDRTAGGGDNEKAVVRGDQAKYEAWRLPENFKNPDGSFNQEALINQQKRRCGFMSEKLAAPFKMTETPHYLVFSSADENFTKTFVKMSEALYTSLRHQFGIDAKDRVWDGKCSLMLFNTRVLFEDYARIFDEFGARGAGAYFAWEANSPKEPQLVHICIPLDDRDVRRLQELFAHEGTHAFFQLYRTSVLLPLWLHEGLAEYMTVVNDPSLAAEKQLWAKYIARDGMSIQPILERPAGMGFSWPAYNVSYTLVDFLVAAGKPKFKKFVDGLKAGKPQEAALKEAYGWTLADLEQRWRVYVNEYLSKRH